MVHTVAVAAGTTVAAGDAAAVGKGTVGVDGVHLADATKCEIYVCFEGPLGAHLKTVVKERIWKGEYVKIFSFASLGEV